MEINVLILFKYPLQGVFMHDPNICPSVKIPILQFLGVCHLQNKIQIIL